MMFSETAGRHAVAAYRRNKEALMLIRLIRRRNRADHPPSFRWYQTVCAPK